MAEDVAYADLNIQGIYSFATAPHPCPGSSTPQCTQWHRVALGVASVVILLLTGAVITLGSWVLQANRTLNGTQHLPDSEFRLQLKRFACNSTGNSTEEDVKKCKICPQDWKVHKESCYQMTEQENTWSKSQEDCRAKNSMLIVIQNPEEMTANLRGISSFSEQSRTVMANLLETECPNCNPNPTYLSQSANMKFIENLTRMTRGSFWLGLTTKKYERWIWEWVDGSPFKEELFSVKRPAEENSCVMKREDEFNSDGCGSFHRWICEKTAFHV